MRYALLIAATVGAVILLTRKDDVLFRGVGKPRWRNN